MVSEQEEDEILLLPQAQLGNMLTSATLDFTSLFYFILFYAAEHLKQCHLLTLRIR